MPKDQDQMILIFILLLPVKIATLKIIGIFIVFKANYYKILYLLNSGGEWISEWKLNSNSL